MKIQVFDHFLNFLDFWVSWPVAGNYFLKSIHWWVHPTLLEVISAVLPRLSPSECHQMHSFSETFPRLQRLQGLQDWSQLSLKKLILSIFVNFFLFFCCYQFWSIFAKIDENWSKIDKKLVRNQFFINFWSIFINFGKNWSKIDSSRKIKKKLTKIDKINFFCN